MEMETDVVVNPDSRASRRERVKALAVGGAGVKEISMVVGASYPTIVGDLRALGLKREKPRFTPELRKALQGRIDGGESVASVAASVGVTPPTLRNHGIVLQPEYSTEEVARVIDLRVAGVKVADVAEALGRTPEAITALIRRRGLAAIVRQRQAEILS